MDRATVDASKGDLYGLSLMLPSQLIEQPLVLSLSTISHEQQRPSCPKQSIGVFLTASTGQPGRFIDAQA